MAGMTSNSRVHVQFDLLNPFLAFARSYEDMKFLAVNFYLALYGQIKKNQPLEDDATGL